jgi:hypothetical protein
MTWFTSKSTYGSGGGAEGASSSLPASLLALAAASPLVFALGLALASGHPFAVAFTVPSLPAPVVSGTTDPL